MNPFEMVVLIVAIVGVVKILRARYTAHADTQGGMPPVADPDAIRMREDLRALKERVAVLERIATDGNRGLSLEREIEALRSRD